MFTFEPIETERLIIRQYRADDLPEVHKLTSDPEVMQFIPCGALSHETISKAFPFIQERKEAEQLTGSHGELPGKLAIQLTSSPRAIGYVDLGYLPHVKEELPEIGYGLQREFWGSGYATEAAQALLEYGFDKCQLRVIVIAVHPDNLRSVRIAKKLGLTYRRTVPWPKVEVNDIYSIIKDEHYTRQGN